MGGGKSTHTTQVTDPYANMPKWLEDAYQEDTRFGAEIKQEGMDILGYLQGLPEQISGISDLEQQSLGRVQGAGDEAAFLRDLGLGTATGGLDSFQTGIGAGDFYNQFAEDMLGTDYSGGYTDKVVDTTLARMQRQMERDRLAREGRNAAIGGTSNVRSAIGQARAEGEAYMNMAEMEAKLRDDAYRFGIDSGFREADLARGLAGDTFGRYADMADYEMGLGEFQSGQGDKALQQALQVGAIEDTMGMRDRGLFDQIANEERSRLTDSLSWMTNIYSGTGAPSAPHGGSSTGGTKENQGWGQMLGGLASVAGGLMMSDERTKEDIEPLDDALAMLRDVTPSSYNYKEGMGHRGDRHAGLIAQDLDRIPGAVVEGGDGLKRVDPYPVLATVVKAVQELDRKLEAA